MRRCVACWDWQGLEFLTPKYAASQVVGFITSKSAILPAGLFTPSLGMTK